MSAILATVDIEDLATPKVQGVKNALAELDSIIGGLGRTNEEISSSLRNTADQLAATATRTKLSAAAYKEIQERLTGLGPAIQQVTARSQEYLATLALQEVEQRTIAGIIGVYAGALAGLGQELRAGTVLTKEQAAALRELAEAASHGRNFTAEQARTLEELNEKVRQGLPLTQQEIDALAKMADEYGHANREALGLASATGQLIDQHRQSQAAMQQMLAGLTLLTVQLKDGAQVSREQKQAFEEIATAAQSMASITEEDRQAFAALNSTLQEGKTLTAEEAAEMQRLTTVMREAVTGTREQVSAIQELLQAERERLAMTREQAEAAKLLESQLKEGTEITDQQRAAARELTAGLKENKSVAESTRSTMEGLTYALDVNHKVSAQMAAQSRLVAEGMKQVGQETASAEGEFGRLQARMAVVATALGVIAAGLVGYLRSSADLAARIEVLGTVQEVMGQNSVNTTYDLKAQEAQIKALGITTQEARDAVIQFTQAELDLSDAAKIARAAQDLAVVAGENSSQTFKRLTTAIQIQQPLLLRQVGIVTGLDAIYRQHAQTLGKTVQQLDANEKKQAFVNKILEEATKVSGAYEQAMNDVGKQMGSMQRLQEELSKEVGERLLPVYRELVGLLNQLYRGWRDTSEGTKDFVVALGVLLASLATVFAVLAGAKFAAAALGFATLTGVIGKTVVALRAGTGLLGALQAVTLFLGGPWVAIVKVAAVALAGLITWYVAWKNASEESNEKRVEESAAITAQIERVEELSRAIFDQKDKINQTNRERDLTEAQMKELEKLAPGVVTLLRQEKVAWEEVAAAIKEANVQREQDRFNKLAAAQRAYLEARRKEAELEGQLAEARERANQQTSASMLARGAVQAQQREAIRTLEQELEAARKLSEQRKKDVYDLDVTAQRYDAMVRARKDAQDVLTELGGTERSDAVMKRRIAQLGVQLQAEMIRTGQEMKKLADGTFQAVIDTDTGKIKVLTAQRFAELQREIEAARDLMEKKEMERRKRFEQALQAARDQLRGESVVGTAKLQALEEELAKTTRGTEEYKEMLRLASDILAYFGKQTDAVRAKHPALQQALDDVKAVKFTEEIRKWRFEMEETGRAFDDFTTGSLRNLQDALEETQAQQSFGLERDRLDTIEKVRQMEEAAIESVALERMTATERAIYQERKRVEEMERNIRRERQARELAFMEEEAGIYRKFELLKREADLRLSSLREEMKLRRASLIDELNRQVAAGTLEESERETKLANYMGEQARLDAWLQAQRDAYGKSLDQYRSYELDLHEEKRKAAKANDAAIDAAMERTRAASQEIVRRILEQADNVRTLVKGVLETILTSWASGLMRMLTGAEKWSDGLKGIFRGIRDSFFNIVDSMITKWVQEFIKRKFLGESAGAVAAALPGGAPGGGAPGGALPGLSTEGLKQFFNTQFGAGLIMAGAGGLVGFQLGKLFNSRTGGALAGAAGGAATGAAIGMIGGPIGAGVGAVIGGIAGAIGGLLSGGREAREVRKLRDELVGARGGIDALRAEARRAGVDISEMLNTKKMEVFKREAMKLETALKFGGMEELRKRAQLVGVEIDKIFKIKDAEKFNKEMERLNGLLAEQARRLEGLKTISEGLQTRATGFVMGLERDLEIIYQGMGPKARATLESAFKAAVQKGFSGTNMQYLLKVLKDVAEGGPNLLSLPSNTIAQFRTLLQEAQKDFDRLGMVAATTFAGVLKETGDLNAAMAAVGPTLDMLIEAQHQFGFQTGTALGKLLEFRKFLKVNEDIATALSGTVQILKGLQEMGPVTQEMFAALGADVEAQYQKLIRRSGDPAMAMLAVQPALQELYEVQKNTGLVLDDNTQKLLDQAKAQGFVGDQFLSVNQKMLEVLVLIAKTLGADLPAAFDRFGDSAERSGERAYNSMTGVAEGYSPGGVRGIITRLGEAEDAVSSFGQHTVQELRGLRGPLDEAAAAMVLTPVVQPVVEDTSALGELATLEQAAQITGRIELPTSAIRESIDNVLLQVQEGEQAFSEMLGGLTSAPLTALVDPLHDAIQQADAFDQTLRTLTGPAQLRDQLAHASQLPPLTLDATAALATTAQMGDALEALPDRQLLAVTATVETAGLGDLQGQLDALAQGQRVSVDLTDVETFQQLLAALPPEATVRIDADTGGALGAVSLLHETVAMVPPVVLDADTSGVWTAVDAVEQAFPLVPPVIPVRADAQDALADLDAVEQAATITGEISMPTSPLRIALRQLLEQAQEGRSIFGRMFGGLTAAPITAVSTALTDALQPATAFGRVVQDLSAQLAQTGQQADLPAITLDVQPALDAATQLTGGLQGIPDAQVTVQTLADTTALGDVELQLAQLATGTTVPVDLREVEALAQLLAALPADAQVRIDADAQGALAQLTLVQDTVARTTTELGQLQTPVLAPITLDANVAPAFDALAAVAAQPLPAVPLDLDVTRALQALQIVDAATPVVEVQTLAPPPVAISADLSPLLATVEALQPVIAPVLTAPAPVDVQANIQPALDALAVLDAVQPITVLDVVPPPPVPVDVDLVPAFQALGALETIRPVLDPVVPPLDPVTVTADVAPALANLARLNVPLGDIAQQLDALGQALPPDTTIRIDASTEGALGSLRLVQDAVTALPDVALNADTRDVVTSIEDLRQQVAEGSMYTLPIAADASPAYEELDQLQQAAQITGEITLPTTSIREALQQMIREGGQAQSFFGGLLSGLTPAPVSAIGAALTSARRPAEIFGLTLGQVPDQLRAAAEEAEGLTVSLDVQPVLDAATVMNETLAGLPDRQVVVQALTETSALPPLHEQLAALTAGYAVPVDLTDVETFQRLLAALPPDVQVRLDANTEGALGSLSLVQEAVAAIPDATIEADVQSVWSALEAVQHASPMVPPISVTAETSDVLTQLDAVEQAATITSEVTVPTEPIRRSFQDIIREAGSARSVFGGLFGGLSPAPVAAIGAALTGAIRPAEIFGLTLGQVPEQAREAAQAIEQMPLLMPVDPALDAGAWVATVDALVKDPLLLQTEVDLAPLADLDQTLQSLQGGLGALDQEFTNVGKDFTPPPLDLAANIDPALQAFRTLEAAAPVIDPVVIDPVVVDPLAPLESSVDRLDVALRTQLPDALQAFSDAALTHGALAEASLTAVALGSSPGGVREIVTQTQLAMDALAQYRDQVARDSMAVERDVLGIAQQYQAIQVPPTGELGMLGMPAYGPETDWMQWVSKYGPQQPAPDDLLIDVAPTVLPGQTPEQAGGLTVVIQQGDVNVEINASAWDGQTAQYAWQTQIRPQLMDDLNYNREQTASDVEAFLSRYRRT